MTQDALYEGRSKSSRPDLVLFRIKLKYYLLLMVARLRTRHAQYDFWAIYILCILVYEHRVCQMVSRMLTPDLRTSFLRTSQTIPTWPSKHLFHNSFIRMKRASTTLILSQNNKTCNGTNELVKIIIFITLRNSVFFHDECKLPTTAKMHKIFTAQKSYSACRVLSLATIRSQ